MSGSTTVDLAPGRQLGALQTILVVGAVCEAAVPWLIGRTLSLATGSPVRLAITMIGFAVTLGLIVLCNVAAYLWLNRLRISMIARLRADVGTQIFTGAAEPTQRTGDIATIVSTDVPNIAGFALARVRLVSAVTGFVAVAGYLLLISPVLAIAVIAGVPLLMYLTKLVSGPLDSRQAEHRRLLGVTAAYTLDIGQGIRVLRAINGAPEFGRRFHHTSLETQRAGIRVAKSQALLQCTSLVLPGVLVLGVVWLGGALADRGSISPAELVTFYAGAAYLVAPITQFASYLSARSEARVGQQNLDVILNIADQGRMPVQPAADQLASAGALRDDRFGIAVPAGSFCVVHCPDGDTAEQAGRSLAALDRSSRATLDGRRLADYPEAAIRNTVRFQGHQTALFAGTLRASVDPHGAHADQELLASLAIADATEIVARLPDGLDSRVESGGRNLSGGQRRRLALARALIGEPAYLILVEPTVGLDAVTEEIVIQNLAAHRTGHTTVIFTSDTAFDAVADRVLVLRPDQLSAPARTGSEQGSAGVLR